MSMRFLVYAILMSSMWLCGLEFRDSTDTRNLIPRYLIETMVMNIPLHCHAGWLI